MQTRGGFVTGDNALTVDDTTSFLRSLGLERYADAFATNDVDVRTLQHLTGDDLRELGVTSVGHRRLLLDAIAGLAASRASEPATAQSQAQRRQLTVLFSDLVGATQLSTGLDPEDLRVVYRRYQAACREAIEQFDGHVAQLLGDGVVAYFGYPHAHEALAERAARAGLELVRRVGSLDAPSGARLSARVGIATGVVVVGDMVATQLREEQPVVGETPNLAARLQSMAPPGGVVLGERTRRLLRGALELVDLGAHELKGFAAPVRIWQVVGEADRREPSSGAQLVDRRRELASLRRMWRFSKEGEGKVVAIEGPAGIGKSRLLRALIDEVRTAPSTVLRYFCSPFHTTSSLYPVRAQLEHAARISRGDDLDLRAEKLATLLGAGSTDHAESFGPLVGLDSPAGLAPQLLKKRMLVALVEALERLSDRTPVLVVVENVHWLDPTTAELLERVVDSCAGRSVLLVLTHRPETELPWLHASHVASLSLGPLARGDCLSLVALHAVDAVPETMQETILANADGIPLFLEELTRSVVERRAQGGHGRDESLRVPETLEDSLLERLDRLGEARHLAQVAAVIGRESSQGFLRELAELEVDVFDEQLLRLDRSGMLVRRDGVGGAVYRFSHALVQQAAYGTLLRERRVELHARVVDMLERTDEEAVERTPELLARHCSAAGLIDKAVDYWQAAGDRAMDQSAEVEAIASYREALGLLAAQAPDERGRRREVELLTSLGVPLLAIHGVASTEPEAVYRRARELANEVGARRELFPTLWGLAVVYSGRGEMERAAGLAAELGAIAATEADPELVLEAHHGAWVYDFFLGRLAAAAAHVAAGRRVAAGLELDRHALLYGGHDPTLCARNFEALLAWLDGRETEAAALGDETLELALRSHHLHTRVHCLAWGAIADQLGGRVDVVERRLGGLRTLADEHGFTEFVAEALVLGGWARVVRGEREQGLLELDEGLALREESGAQHLMPYLLGVCAHAHELAGDPGGALARLDTALRLVEATGERWYEPELHRARAAALRGLGSGSPADVEAAASRAYELAREQRSRTFERRAAGLLQELGITPGLPTLS